MTPTSGLSLDARVSHRDDLSEDAPLISRARAGDDEAFAAIYTRYREAVYAVCLKRLRDASLAEDVVQDTFMRAYACLDRFDITQRLLPWLVSIAVRRCTDLFRRNGRTEATEDVELMLAEYDGADPTLDAVMASEDRRRLERALRKLAPRQRRALLLHAIEGWSYADIASAEGVSVASTKSLLFHARENLRRACRRGLLAALVIPGGLRARIRRIGWNVRTRAQSAAEPFVGVTGNSLASGLAALVLAATAAGATPVVTHAAGARDVAAVASAPTGPSGANGAGVHGAAAPAAVPRAVPLTGSLLDPAAGATPDDTQFHDFAASPQYEKDHTILAAGAVPCAHSTCPVLFRSSNSGATWTRLRARGFNGYRLLLPPAFPVDRRIFAMGPSGLQRSDDGGRTFRTVHPVEGEAAMSPLFNVGDPRILVAAGTVFEYWADSGLVKPASLLAPAGLRLTVAFSPSFPQDDRFFVGGLGVDTRGVQRPAIHRCAGVACEQSLLPSGSGVPQMRVSPGFASDRLAYVFTTDSLFRSIDGGASFAALAMPGAHGERIGDLLISRRNGYALLAGVTAGAKVARAIYTSTDGGRTWRGYRIARPGFEFGVSSLASVGKTLLAGGSVRGLACSRDGGRTWAAYCAA